LNEEGKLFDFANLDVVDDFSREFYEKVKGWPLARFGAWSTWAGDPYYSSNYLLLDLSVVSERGSAEPACIYTSDEELTLATRGWHEHSFPADDPWDHVRVLTERWFNSEFLVVSYFDGDAWKGTITIAHDEDVRTELIRGLAWVRERFNATRVELRSPYKSADRTFAIGAHGIDFPG
jgi:hypothetical protein